MRLYVPPEIPTRHKFPLPRRFFTSEHQDLARHPIGVANVVYVPFRGNPKELINKGAPPSVIVLYVLVQPPVETREDEKRGRVKVRRDVRERLRRESQQQALCISWCDGGPSAMAVGMSMLASGFVRCRRSVLRNVLVLSLQGGAIVHKMSCVCLNAKVGRRRTVLSAMVVVVVQVRKSRFQSPGLPCRKGANIDLSALVAAAARSSQDLYSRQRPWMSTSAKSISTSMMKRCCLSMSSTSQIPGTPLRFSATRSRKRQRSGVSCPSKQAERSVCNADQYHCQRRYRGRIDHGS